MYVPTRYASNSHVLLFSDLVLGQRGGVDGFRGGDRSQLQAFLDAQPLVSFV